MDREITRKQGRPRRWEVFEVDLVRDEVLLRGKPVPDEVKESVIEALELMKTKWPELNPFKAVEI